MQWQWCAKDWKNLDSLANSKAEKFKSAGTKLIRVWDGNTRRELDLDTMECFPGRKGLRRVPSDSFAAQLAARMEREHQQHYKNTLGNAGRSSSTGALGVMTPVSSLGSSGSLSRPSTAASSDFHTSRASDVRADVCQLFRTPAPSGVVSLLQQCKNNSQFRPGVKRTTTWDTAIRDKDITPTLFHPAMAILQEPSFNFGDTGLRSNLAPKGADTGEIVCALAEEFAEKLLKATSSTGVINSVELLVPGPVPPEQVLAATCLAFYMLAAVTPEVLELNRVEAGGASASGAGSSMAASGQLRPYTAPEPGRMEARFGSLEPLDTSAKSRRGSAVMKQPGGGSDSGSKAKQDEQLPRRIAHGNDVEDLDIRAEVRGRAAARMRQADGQVPKARKGLPLQRDYEGAKLGLYSDEESTTSSSIRVRKMTTALNKEDLRPATAPEPRRKATKKSRAPTAPSNLFDTVFGTVKVPEKITYVVGRDGRAAIGIECAYHLEGAPKTRSWSLSLIKLWREWSQKARTSRPRHYLEDDTGGFYIGDVYPRPLLPVAFAVAASWDAAVYHHFTYRASQQVQLLSEMRNPVMATMASPDPVPVKFSERHPLREAIALTSRGEKVLLAMVGSATFVGGNFFRLEPGETLEEEVCMCSTLHMQLMEAYRVARNAKLSDSEGSLVHIPEDGALLCPGTTVLRQPAEKQYVPLDKPLQLGGVALFSLPNLTFRATPSRGPATSKPPAQLSSRFSQKMRMVFRGAMNIGATSMILCAHGAEELGNDQRLLGTAIGDCILKCSDSSMPTIYLAGQLSFKQGAMLAIRSARSAIHAGAPGS